MEKEQTVLEMAEEVLLRQARALAAQTQQPFGRALEAVSNTEAGRNLRALAESESRFQRAAKWQANLRLERVLERQYSWVEDYLERLEGKEKERQYSWVESYMQRLEGKEERAHYYELVEEELEIEQLASLRG